MCESQKPESLGAASGGSYTVDFDVVVRTFDSTLKTRLARQSRCCPADVDEVAQEAWLAAYERRERFLSADHVAGWVTVYAKRLARDRSRSWYQRRVTTVSEPPDAATGDDLAERMVADDDARDVWLAIAALSPRQRGAVWARDVEGWSYAEIGRVFAMSEAAVRSLLHRARGALRREYLRRAGVVAAIVAKAVESRWRLASSTAETASGAGAVAAGLAAGAIALLPAATAPPLAEPPGLLRTAGRVAAARMTPGKAPIAPPTRPGDLVPPAAPATFAPNGARPMMPKYPCESVACSWRDAVPQVVRLDDSPIAVAAPARDLPRDVAGSSSGGGAALSGGGIAPAPPLSGPMPVVPGGAG